MKRIIVAEDDRMTSHLLCAVLRKGGYAAESAFDVSSLFVLCEQLPVPDAVLLDLNMPGGTGTDSIRRLKRTGALAHVPVIIISGSSVPEDQATALALGAYAFLCKPIDPQSLLDALRAALDIVAI